MRWPWVISKCFNYYLLHNKLFTCFKFKSNSDICILLTMIELSLKSAEVIVLTAFGCHLFKQLSRSQLDSAGKTLSVPLDTRRALSKGGKTEYLIPLAKGFLKNGIIKVRKGASLASLARDDIRKMKTF